MPRLILLLSFFIVFTTCRKDALINSECEEIPPSQSSNWMNPEYAPVLYWSPCYNPQNEDEIVYARGNIPTGGELRIHNLRTGENRGLGQVGMEQPQWNKQGWILFSHYGKISKVKSNGDSLKQLTDLAGYSPSWSPDGTRIMYSNIDNSRGLRRIYIMDAEGNFIQRLDSTLEGYPRWSNNGTKVCIGVKGGPAIYDLQTKELLRIPNADFKSELGHTWTHDDQSIISCTGTAVYQTNINTRQTFKYDIGCMERGLKNPALSPDGKFILFHRVKYKLIGEDQVRYESFIYRLRLDTYELERLDLP